MDLFPEHLFPNADWPRKTQRRAIRNLNRSATNKHTPFCTHICMYITLRSFHCLLRVFDFFFPGLQTLNTAHLSSSLVLLCTGSMIMRRPNHTVRRCARVARAPGRNIKWRYFQNETLIPAIWNDDTVFRAHFALTCKKITALAVYLRGADCRRKGEYMNRPRPH